MTKKYLILALTMVISNISLAAIDCDSNINDPGWPNGRANIDLERNGDNYNCRVIGDDRTGWAVRCNGITGRNKGKSFCTSSNPIFDVGYNDKPRSWIVVDNSPRYCRYIGQDPYIWKRCSVITLSSNLLKEGAYYDTEIPEYDKFPGKCICGDGSVPPSSDRIPNECMTHEACNFICAGHGGGSCTGKHPKK